MRAWTAGRLGVGAFGLACVVLVFGSISVQRMADLGEATQSVDRTLVLREETEVFLSLLKDAETGQRGFVITGDRHYLAPYDAAQALVGRQLERLGGLTGEMADQHARVAALQTLVRRKLDELRDTITAREGAGFEAAARIVATGQGMHVMDEIRSVIDEMRGEEAGLLVERRAVAAREARLTTATTLGGLTVAFGLLVAAGLLLNSAVVERERERAARTTAQALAAVLAESEAWLRVTLTSIGDAVVATDEHGRVKLMNRVAESLTGWSEDDASGRALADVFVIVNEQSRRPVPNPADKVLRDRKIAGLANHTILIAKDGREIPIDDSAAPILAADGALLGVVLVFRDISSRRRYERERAVLLDNEQKASHAKDVFLAALSHELRTPLSAVLGWVKMLRAGLMGDKAATEHALDVIERNARHQARLIDDLLDVSRIVKGKLTLEVGPVDLARLIETAVESMRPSADVRGISLTRVVDRSVGTVQGDAGRLQQVVGNLLSNGVKFTPAGGGVEVRLVGADDRAHIIVTDTGRGIDAAFLPHVFETFRQAGDTTGRADPGLGLGLAIVRYLVELHGGTVSASSEGQGKGATFTVQLPLAGTAHDVGIETECVLNGSGGDLEALRGLRVLVVDDDRDIRDLVIAALSHHGARAAAVGSGADARRMFAKSPPDVLVCDIALPDEDGVALIAELRRRGRDQGGAVPAVAMSAYARPEDRDRALAAGFQRYLAKPVDVLELIAVVAVLHRERAT